jgi:hypothetical protein
VASRLLAVTPNDTADGSAADPKGKCGMKCHGPVGRVCDRICEEQGLDLRLGEAPAMNPTEQSDEAVGGKRSSAPRYRCRRQTISLARCTNGLTITWPMIYRFPYWPIKQE